MRESPGVAEHRALAHYIASEARPWTRSWIGATASQSISVEKGKLNPLEKTCYCSGLIPGFQSVAGGAQQTFAEQSVNGGPPSLKLGSGPERCSGHGDEGVTDVTDIVWYGIKSARQATISIPLGAGGGRKH